MATESRHEAGDGQEERGAEDSKPRDDLMGRLHNSKVWHTNLPRAVAGAKIIKLQSQLTLFALSIDGLQGGQQRDKHTAPQLPSWSRNVTAEFGGKGNLSSLPPSFSPFSLLSLTLFF